MGWRVTKGPKQHLAEIDESEYLKTPLATVEKGPLKSSIPPAFFGRLGYEFLRPRTIYEMLEALLAAGPTDFNQTFTNLAGEAEQWD